MNDLPAELANNPAVVEMCRQIQYDESISPLRPASHEELAAWFGQMAILAALVGSETDAYLAAKNSAWHGVRALRSRE